MSSLFILDINTELTGEGPHCLTWTSLLDSRNIYFQVDGQVKPIMISINWSQQVQFMISWMIVQWTVWLRMGWSSRLISPSDGLSRFEMQLDVFIIGRSIIDIAPFCRWISWTHWNGSISSPSWKLTSFEALRWVRIFDWICHFINEGHQLADHRLYHSTEKLRSDRSFAPPG